MEWIGGSRKQACSRLYACKCRTVLAGVKATCSRRRAGFARGNDGQLVYALRKRVRVGDKAASGFWRVRQFLERHYDVMIVDVMNKDKRLMQLFYDVSDEVHLMLRDSRPHSRSEADWRRYIERETVLKNGPKIITPKVITHSDRNYIRGNVDAAGQSIALKPFIDAVQSSQGGLRDAP
jgi:hypothetical protein